MAAGVFTYKPSVSGSASGSASVANSSNTTDAETKPSNSTSPSPATATTKRPTRNQYAKAGWGSRMNFQRDDDDWEEGNRILDAMIDGEMESRQIDAQEGGGGK